MASSPSAVIDQKTRSESPRAGGKGSSVASGLGARIVITHEEHAVIDQALAAVAGGAAAVSASGRAWCGCSARRRRGGGRGSSVRQGGKRIAAAAPFATAKAVDDPRRVVPLGPNRREKGPQPAHPPAWAIEGLANLGVWPGIRPLEGIVEAPTLRPDGSLLDTPGYDPATGLWFEPEETFPAIPERPTPRRSAGRRRLVAVDRRRLPVPAGHARGHRAAWLAALLTPLARPAIDGPCPLFLFDANCPGTGKSKLCDIIAILATGREMPRGSYSDNQEEMQKMILSAATGRRPVGALRQCGLGEQWRSAGALDRALTARTIKGRILGRSEMPPS